ncbi:hypothetical protein Rumeso_02649 [Rubellimicrobium mesophilum DSM 19309]|uniref:Uncharacterized protein n=1 Tax=Rubellimicrobium mesophilum DSM 19309 TaxID=442562 RepID=A0A017HN02_9RHOB|nr:hypothetical protein [Rubellimicrobium mesophilum]EYD75867.1 hypothetical protein Rumeso_02649 [Rubellimicrobium mesophilum DSM 19309]
MDEDNVIELITENESNKARSAAGGEGDDEIRSWILADAEVATQDAVAHGNTHTVTGDAGQDVLRLITLAYGFGGFSALASGNTNSASGGEEDDGVTSALGAFAYSGDATVTGNSHRLLLDEGEDFLTSDLFATALSGNNALASGNTLLAAGGEDNDEFELRLDAMALYVRDAIASTATTSNNTLVARGGEGADAIGLEVTVNSTLGGIATLTDKHGLGLRTAPGRTR